MYRTRADHFRHAKRQNSSGPLCGIKQPKELTESCGRKQNPPGRSLTGHRGVRRYRTPIALEGSIFLAEVLMAITLTSP